MSSRDNVSVGWVLRDGQMIVADLNSFTSAACSSKFKTVSDTFIYDRQTTVAYTHAPVT